MKNLHQIHTILDDNLKSQVWYWRDHARYRIKIEGNKLYYRYNDEQVWETGNIYDNSYVLKRWKQSGSPAVTI